VVGNRRTTASGDAADGARSGRHARDRRGRGHSVGRKADRPPDGSLAPPRRSPTVPGGEKEMWVSQESPPSGSCVTRPSSAATAANGSAGGGAPLPSVETTRPTTLSLRARCCSSVSEESSCWAGPRPEGDGRSHTPARLRRCTPSRPAFGRSTRRRVRSDDAVAGRVGTSGPAPSLAQRRVQPSRSASLFPPAVAEPPPRTRRSSAPAECPLPPASPSSGPFPGRALDASPVKAGRGSVSKS